ncbi:MAG TPA: hypothetical protein VHK69_20925 [Chitinophagaceae bacterium]|jgi:hypothetical protein|nr:hypothetical protein [Chitinophagaceae bacterium]
MRRAFTLATILIVIAGFLYFTKPSDEACFAEARAAFRKDLDRMEAAMPQTVNRDVFRAVSEKIFQQEVRVEDRMLFKVVYQRKGGLDQQVGWAAGGYISVNLK